MSPPSDRIAPRRPAVGGEEPETDGPSDRLRRVTEFNLADLWEMVADAVPERIAVVCGEVRRSYRELDERATRLAHWMRAQGVQPGQHVGCYLHNGPEYLETLFAAYKLRAVPINVNYRYVTDELAYLFADADLVGVVHHATFSAEITAIRPRLPNLGWCLTVAGEGGDGETPPDRHDYEEALAAQNSTRDFGPRRGDDPYVIYTGGTTGLPKGVVWRSEDAFFACLGGGDAVRTQGPVTTPAELVGRILPPVVFLPVAPLMHAAGSWTVLMWLFAGATIVLLPGSLDPTEVWRTAARERVNSITVVGDPVLRPLLDAWDALDSQTGRVRAAGHRVGRGAAVVDHPAAGVGHVPGRAAGRWVWLVGDGHPGRDPLRPADRGPSPFDVLPGRRGRAGRGHPRAGGAGVRPGRPGRPQRAHPARLLPRPGQDGPHLRHVCRAAVGHERRHGHGGRRRHDHGARPGLAVHQHRGREGLPRGGRSRAARPPRGIRRGRRRRPGRSLGPAGRGVGSAGCRPGRLRPANCGRTAGRRWPATRCPRRW